MWRAIVIICLSGLFMVSGIATASPGDQIEIPFPVSFGPDGGEVDDTHVAVRPGDHLWKISARHLQESSPTSDVAPYWRRVVAVNTPNLRSGDPDLIYPGEMIELPELGGRP